MSVSEILRHETPAAPSQAQSASEPWDGSHPVLDVLQRVREIVAPVWPLRDYVAVNPYLGMTDRPFLNARQFLRVFSECETLMPLDYYRTRYDAGAIRTADIAAALEDVREQYHEGAPRLEVSDVIARLRAADGAAAADGAPVNGTAQPLRSVCRITAISEVIDEYTQSDWTDTIREEVSKFCAAHYDEGQASWSSPWKGLPLYQAWRSVAQVDRRIEILGLTGFRRFVSQLPHAPESALAVLLERLGVPPKLWETFLLCQAFLIPGWSAWARYQEQQAERKGQESVDFAGLLAIRLAYDAAVSDKESFRIDWSPLAGSDARAFTAPLSQSHGDALHRYVLLRASEIAFQRRLVETLQEQRPTGAESVQTRAAAATERRLAQMVFCIDVRSERLRRHLETASSRIATSGFAGFFGLPIQYIPLDESEGTPQVPALLSPQIRVAEGLRDADSHTVQTTVARRRFVRLLRKAWKRFQSSAVSCFGFVETTGLLYAPALIRRVSGWGGASTGIRFDGVAAGRRGRLGPVLATGDGSALTLSEQADLAESILRGLGLTENFAQLVVFCGHASRTENNPLQAGLDCGACCGHSGEPNARLAAQLLNDHDVRRELVERGIDVPADVHFLAAVHDTTNDTLEFCDLDLLPRERHAELQELQASVHEACAATRRERMPLLSAQSLPELLRRSRDWSEVRPEWGLAGNAAFIVGPRRLTQSRHLDGRAFLHDYDPSRDHDHALLEQIMTAPMVVAHWINMQYYASTVDNEHFGSGNKTVHNVVGRFGVFSGNGGDLMTGLPWQSLHDGKSYQHEPLRLLVVIAARREAIQGILEKHAMLEDLVVNGWLNLMALDEGTFYRYTVTRNWIAVGTEEADAETLSCLDAQ